MRYNTNPYYLLPMEEAVEKTGRRHEVAMKTDAQPPHSLSRVFIERPRFAAVVAIVMAVARIIALPHLAMEEFPEIAPSQIYVSASYAGADAQSVTAAS